MKKVFCLIALYIIGASPLFAQILQPVKWSYAAKRTSSTDAIIYLKADIEEGWHIYSTREVPAGGPVKTSFAFANSRAFTLTGTVIEPKPVNAFEPNFNMEINYFENAVIFQQKIKVVPNKPVSVAGSVNFMVCNNEKCLPPETINFKIPVK